MEPSDHALEAPAGPEASLADLVRWLEHTAGTVLPAFLIGALAARVMRHRGLHWSWALAGAGAALLAGLLAPRARDVLLLAALWAAVGGRRRHHRDLEAGADLAQLAAAQLRPHDVLAPLLRALARRARPPGGPSSETGGAVLALGRDERGRTVSVPLGAREGRHLLVVGATGSGKTVTQSWIATHAIARGLGAIVMDPKGDFRLRGEIHRAARAAGRSFVAWSPRGEAIYNPLATGGGTEIADRVLAGERFSEPHYLRQAQRYLGHAVRAMRAGGVHVSLHSLVEHLDVQRLEVLARTLPERHADAVHAYLDALTPRQQTELAGVRDRLAILAESDVGPYLDPRRPGTQLELGNVVREGGVAYFALEADRRPLLAAMLGAAIVQDVLGLVAALQVEPTPTLVLIDEFSAVAAEQVVRLFARARSAGFSLLLGTQELSDLRLPGRERLLEQVVGNVSALVAHRQVVPASAELLAQIAGAEGTWRVARDRQGRVTRARAREAVIDAGRISRLPTGWAAVIVPGGRARARIARVFMPAAPAACAGGDERR